MSKMVKFILAFILLIGLQLFVFNNIQYSGYINPYIYVMFIILLPVSIPSWIVLLISFFTGFVIDAFSGTMGVHTFATVMAGFAKPWLMSLNVTHDPSDAGAAVSIKNYGLRWFSIITLMVVLIHHLTLFYVEIFSFSGFFRTLLRVLVSTAFSTFFIILLNLIRSRR